MNLEVISQVCDILAFTLVTPELLGEERLRAFRDAVRARSLWIVLPFAASAIFLFYIGVSQIASYFESIVPAPESWWGLLVGAVAMPVLVSVLVAIIDTLVIPALVVAAESFAFRGRLFVAGVIFFFAARGISIWEALHPAVARIHI